MEFKSYADIQALQSQFTSRFEKRLEELKKELPKSMDQQVSSKRAAIKQAQEAMKAAEKTRDSLVKRASAQVTLHKEAVVRLTRELAELEGGMKKAAKAKTPSRPAKPK